MAYIAHKSRIFRTVEDSPPPKRRRSEGRLKRYFSEVDSRAWSLWNDDRRQHIFEFIALDVEQCYGASNSGEVEWSAATAAGEKKGKVLSGAARGTKAKAATAAGEKHGRSLSAAETELKTQEEAERLRAEAEKASLLTERSGRSERSEVSEVSEATRCARMQRKCQMRSAESEFEAALRSNNPEVLRKALNAKADECSQQSKIARAAIDKLESLKGIMEESNNLKKKLEDSYSKIQTLKDRTEELKTELDQRNNLEQRLETMQGMEEELQILKKKADQLDELHLQYSNLSSELLNMKRASAIEMYTMKNEKAGADAELQQLREERDQLQRLSKVTVSTEAELQRLRLQVMELDAVKAERDRLRARVKELGGSMAEGSALIKTTSDERDTYKEKFEELLGLECECDILRARLQKCVYADQERQQLLLQLGDCECRISDQEEEIAKLVGDIDCLCTKTKQQQTAVTKRLSKMQQEFQERSRCLANSDMKLAEVQKEYNTTVEKSTCETQCLRARIAQLEELLNIAEKENQQMKEKLNNGNHAELQTEEYSTFVSDAHLELLLKHCKSAVSKIMSELNVYVEKQHEISRVEASAVGDK